MTLEYALVRYAGYYTEEAVRAGFAERDKNDNGYLCYNTPGHDRYYPLVYFFAPDDMEYACRC